jgi:hypothetical protein
MKQILTIILGAGIMLGCNKSESNDDKDNNGSCAPNTNVCFALNGSTVAFSAAWVDLLGSKVAIKASNSSVDFNMDIGTKLEVKTYTIDNGSLWSGNARISFTNKATNKSYTAISGTLSITNAQNSKLTGTFSGVFKDNSTNTNVNFTDGKISAVGQ